MARRDAGAGLASQEADEAAALQVSSVVVHTDEVEQRRHEIHHRHRSFDAARREVLVRDTQHAEHAEELAVQLFAVPEAAAIAEAFAMVADEQHDRVFVEAAGFECIQEPLELAIDEPHFGVVEILHQRELVRPARDLVHVERRTELLGARHQRIGVERLRHAGNDRAQKVMSPQEVEAAHVDGAARVPRLDHFVHGSAFRGEVVLGAQLAHDRFWRAVRRVRFVSVQQQQERMSLLRVDPFERTVDVAREAALADRIDAFETCVARVARELLEAATEAEVRARVAPFGERRSAITCVEQKLGQRAEADPEALRRREAAHAVRARVEAGDEADQRRRGPRRCRLCVYEEKELIGARIEQR